MIKTISDPDRRCSWCEETFHDNKQYPFWIIDYSKNKQFHIKCVKRQLQNDLAVYSYPSYWIYPSCSKDLIGIQQISKPMQIKIIQTLWPEYLPDNIQFKQNITTKLQNMDEKRLKKELSKRDISQYIIQGSMYNPLTNTYTDARSTYIQRLTRYYQTHHKEINEMMKIMIEGYCRKIQFKYSLVIPKYLIFIIVRYFPHLLT